jgi:hypothetical protein
MEDLPPRCKARTLHTQITESELDRINLQFWRVHHGHPCNANDRYSASAWIAGKHRE